MLAIEIDDLNAGYVELVDQVRKHGKKTAPRGHETLEVLNPTICLLDPTQAMPLTVGRKPNLAIGAAEALQLIGGFSDPMLMTSITKTFKKFMDGGELSGAYGPRIRTQLADVVTRLNADPDTRQACVFIWDPLRDGIGSTPRDLPCTLLIQFIIRDGKLSACVKMRSNDVYLGVPYDFFQFCQLQMSVANVLGLPFGPYYHHATSLHLYERDLEKADALDATASCTACSLTDDGVAGDTWPLPEGFYARTADGIQEEARRLYDMCDLSHVNSYTQNWYNSHLKKHLLAKVA